MNSKNKKTSDLHRLSLNLSEKLNLKTRDKYVAPSNFSKYNTWKITKKLCKNNKFKISTTTWNEEFKLPAGSNSVSDIQDYFVYIIEKRETFADNPPITIYVNKIENRITFKIKTEHYLQLLAPETMKLLGSTNNKITKDENDENAPHLEITEVILVHFNILNNDYQQYSKSLVYIYS